MEIIPKNKTNNNHESCISLTGLLIENACNELIMSKGKV